LVTEWRNGTEQGSNEGRRRGTRMLLSHTSTDSDQVKRGAKRKVPIKETNHNQSSTLSDIVDERRKNAVAAKHVFREYQRRKMIRHRKGQVSEIAVNVGSVVVIRLDGRDVAHARGLVGVVFDIGKGAGIQVVTEAGVVSSDGNAYFVPADRYRVVSDEAVAAIVSKSLLTLRASILAGHFQPELLKTMSIVKAYKAEYDETPLSSSGWGCRKNCERNCGCRKNNRACGDSCRCRGMCANTLNET
jgi:hypothetical protein